MPAAAARAVMERETREEEAAALKKLVDDIEVRELTRQAIAPREWTYRDEMLVTK